MRWRVPLAILALLVLAGCQPHFGPIAPADLPALNPSIVATWIADVAPSHAVRYDLVWHFDNKQGAFAGRAVVRIAPPDSLRFDYRAGFGRSGAAVVLRDSALWMKPQAEVGNLMPSVPLFWLALGAPQPPPVDAQVFGVEKGGVRMWRIVRGRERMDVVVESGPAGRLRARWQRDGVVVGTCEVSLSGRWPTKATLIFPETAASAASRFAFSVDAADTLVQHDPTIWSPPR